MHVFSRKQALEIPSPTEKDWLKKDEEEDFFLKDPDEVIDSLPQPFRMINKILNLLLERAWEIIEGEHPLLQLEKKQLKKIAAALYQPSDEFQIAGRANCFVASRDYIFLGLSTGLSVFSTLKCEQLCAWEAAKLEISTIQISDFPDGSYILGTVDELGIARLFIFYKENFLHVKAMNEVEDISKRNACVAMEISHGSDYAGFLLQGSSEAWLEIYRLPKDSWLKEIQTAVAAPVVTQVPGTAKDLKTSQLSLPEKKRSADVTAIAIVEEVDLPQILSKVESKLIAPLLLLKLKPPKSIAASLFKSPFEALMKIDDGSVLGLGHNHMIKECQCERLETLFNNTFQQYLETEDELEGKEEKPSHAMFHFLSSGRTLPATPENKADSAFPIAFSVHWSKSHNLFFYFLSRPPKEKTDSDPRPDVVWPCAAPVICSATSPCSSFLAFACEDGTVTVWDRSLGFPLSVSAIPEDYAIRSIHFMPCSVPPSEKMPCCSKHPAITKVKLLVLCTEGFLHLITSGTKECNTKLLGYRPEAPNQTISAVATIPALPDAVLVFFWNGIVNLMDTATEDNFCQFIIPPSYKVASPWQPVFSVDTDSRYFILRGDDASGGEAIFLFSFVTYPFMETFAERAEQPSDPLTGLSWDKRCDVFLNESLQQLSTVSQQIPECWSQLQDYAAALNRGESGEANESAEPRADEDVNH